MKGRLFCERCGQDDADMLYYYYKPYGRFLCAHCVTDMAMCFIKRSPNMRNMSVTEVFRTLGLVEVEKYFREQNNSEKEERCESIK